MAFGLFGRNAVGVRPDPDLPATQGIAPQNLWAKNRSANGANDGYEFCQTDLNEIVGQLRTLLVAIGGDLNGTVGNELAVALVAALDAKRSIADELFLGSYDNLAALQAAYPEGEAGQWAILQRGSGTNASTAIWDSDNTTPAWVDTGVAPSTLDWSAITNKPSTFSPSAHTHPIADVAGLQDGLDSLQGGIDSKLGVLSKTVADWNGATDNGFYTGELTTNNPLGSDNRWWLGFVVNHGGTGWARQQLWDFANSRNMYARSRVDGAWQAWVQVGTADGQCWHGDNKASTAEIRAGTAVKGIDVSNAFAANAWVTVAYAATIAIDQSTGFDFTTTLTGNCTLGTMTNKKQQSGIIEVKQDTTGGYTLAFSTDFVIPGGTPTIDTAANARNYFSYRTLADNKVLLTYLGSD